MSISQSEILSRRAAMVAEQREAAAAFVDAIARENMDRLRGATGLLCDRGGDWRRALRAVARGCNPSDKFRREFLLYWIAGGAELRDWACDDLLLIDFLRATLPKYTGRDAVLYRGDSASCRKRRSYGMSWTNELNTARLFAENHRHLMAGGTLVLRAEVPAAAIVSAPAEISDVYDEQEYLVDRRRLRRVEVVERMTESAPPDSHRPPPPAQDECRVGGSGLPVADI